MDERKAFENNIDERERWKILEKLNKNIESWGIFKEASVRKSKSRIGLKK